MTSLVIGLILFLGVHSLRIVAEPWRRHMVSRFGLGAWKAAYSLIAIAGLTLIVMGWSQARLSPVVLWVAPVWMKHLAALCTVFAFVLLTAAYVPGNAIRAALGHPMVAGVKLWALSHLLVSGTLAGTVLFSSFLVWATVDFVSARRRDRRAGLSHYRGPWVRNFITVVLGLVSWGLFAFWIHPWLIGLAPLGRV